MDAEIRERAEAVLETCRAAGLMAACVESCTGGLLAAALTALAGSSDVLERGFVTYSNQAKTQQVGVPTALIEAHGAVSEPVARAMAEGGLANSNADIAAAITGVAGPGGGTALKPVGLVHIAASRRGAATVHQRHVFPGDRAAIREASVLAALRLIESLARWHGTPGRTSTSGRSAPTDREPRPVARRKRLIGVDFSGARDAGRKIWVAAATRLHGRLVLEDCAPAAELPGGAADKTTALAALVAFLLSERQAVAGLDFPFSLPEMLIDAQTWEGFLHDFARRYPSPEAFREDCRRRADHEIKRRTDVEARVPFCVYNLWLYRQTHAGMANVLLPLFDSGRARIVPMQRPAAGKTTVVEICPASILKSEGLYVPYKDKGGGPRLRASRQRLLASLVERGLLAPPPPSLAERIVEDRGGDGLDAVLAAIGAGRVPERLPRPDRLDLIEGRIYF